MSTEEPFIVRKYGVPDYRSPEQRAVDDAVAPAMESISREMSEAIDLQFSGDQVSVDAVRCRPADAEPSLERTWQEAYAGPRPYPLTDHATFPVHRRTRRERLADLLDNLLIGLITALDERTRRRRP